MSKIKVALRVRPLSARERDEKYPLVVQVENNSAFITDIRVPEKPAADSRQRFRQFDFDHAFWLTDCCEWGATQEEVYNEMAPALEKSILQGYNACLLAYGQSGTGKTHTMLGTKTDPGLIPRLCNSLWEKLREGRENSSFRMEVSFMEIYREKVRDLLTPDKPLKLREHPQNGPHVQDLTRVEVTEEIGLVDLLWEGERRRAIGTTGSNRRSSRSHAIWTLYLTYRDGPDYQNLITNQVHLVDLAGSEKADLTATKHLLAEGADINRSLVSLGNVISSLAEKLSYIPYRDSALTWLLKDSLGGNANTSIIITASPASCSHAQTLNSLRFAQRARLVENKPQVNLTSCPNRSSESYIASIFDIRKDISRLASILKVAQNNGGILRGLTPRNGWNRLITAIESWNHVHESHSKSFSRANSTETTTASTMTNNSSVKSLDVMVQPNGADYKPADLQYEDARNCNSASVPSTPCRNANSDSSPTISSSSSIKCLTWAQSELAYVPKPPTPAESEDEYMSPPQTPKIHHLKYMIPVHFPTSHSVEVEGRMVEKIHRNLKCDYPEAQRLTPTVTPDLCGNRLLIRDQIPTLVSPQKLDNFDAFNESSSSPANSPSGDSPSPIFLGAFDSEQVDESYSQNFQVQPPHRNFVLAKGTGRKRTHRAPPKVKEFATPKPEELFLFESTDEGEFSDCLEIELNQSGNKNFRTVDLSQVSIHDTPTPPFTSLESYSDTSSNASTSSTKRSTSSSSSSYESLVLQKPVGHVKVVENSVFNFPEDHVSDVTPDDFKILEKRVTAVAFGEAKDVEEKLSEAEEASLEENVKTPEEASAFRSFYRRELHQLDQIGKQIKSLQNLAQRYDVLKPYLKKIEELQNQDFTLPDPEIDPLIEHCSGWNVDIEFRKVQNEVVSISKILKNNPGDKMPGLPRRDSSSASNHSHRTSSTSITTSDSYSITDPNSRRGSNASTFDLPRPRFPSLVSTFTISSDLDSSFSLSAPNSSTLSFNVSQSLSQPDVSTPTQHLRKFNMPPELSQPLPLNFDYGRRKEQRPSWTPQSPTQPLFQSPTHHRTFQSPAHHQPYQSPMSQHAYQSPTHPQTFASPTHAQTYQSPSQQMFHPETQGFFPAPPGSYYGMPSPMTYPYNSADQQWRPYPTSPPEVKSQFAYPMNGLNGKTGFSPPHNNNNGYAPPPLQNVWSPVNYPTTPPTKLNGYKTDPFAYPTPPYQHSQPDYGEYKGYDSSSSGQHHYSSQPNGMNVQVGGGSPYRSLSIEGDFANLSTSSSFCKSCAMEFCSCQESLSSSKTSQEFVGLPTHTNKVNPGRVKGQSRRPNHLRSVFSSYNSSSSQFSP